MKNIVILDKQFDPDNPLIRILTTLFPECEINIIPDVLNGQEKNNKGMDNKSRVFSVDRKI